MPSNEAYCDTWRGQLGYAPTPMNPPPSEFGPNVLQFSLTEGCPHNTCTFCEMYRRTPFREKTLEEFEGHVDEVWGQLRQQPEKGRGINRIFIGAGNALAANTQKLLEASRYALIATKKATGVIPRRAAIYGNTEAIVEKGRYDLNVLYCGGTCDACSVDFVGDRVGIDVVYWGLESGSTEVLRLAGKGYDSYEAGLAGEILWNSKLRPSVMVIPGLGGRKFFREHVEETARVLNIAKPTWLTFMGLVIGPETPYARWMQRAEQTNENQRLTPVEIVEQTAEMIERISFRTMVGIHGPEVHFGVQYNPCPIGVYEITSRSDTRELAQHLREKYRRQISGY